MSLPEPLPPVEVPLPPLLPVVVGTGAEIPVGIGVVPTGTVPDGAGAPTPATDEIGKGAELEIAGAPGARGRPLLALMKDFGRGSARTRERIDAA